MERNRQKRQIWEVIKFILHEYFHLCTNQSPICILPKIVQPHSFFLPSVTHSLPAAFLYLLRYLYFLHHHTHPTRATFNPISTTNPKPVPLAHSTTFALPYSSSIKRERERVCVYIFVLSLLLSSSCRRICVLQKVNFQFTINILEQYNSNSC